MTAVTDVQGILEAGWGLSSPAKADINWTSTRYETLAYPQATQSVTLSVYSPPNPVSSILLTRELLDRKETVIIDVLVANSQAGQSTALASRSAMLSEVYRILGVNQRLSGYIEVYPLGEPAEIESPDLLRAVIRVMLHSLVRQGS